MRRFSQRGSMVTLSEINITPLLDLAFVLLIIFVITTPLLEQSVNLKLPAGGTAKPATVSPRDVVTVEAEPGGGYRVGSRRLANEAELEKRLSDAFHVNPNLVVRVRMGKSEPFQRFVTVRGVLERCGITRADIATEPEGRR